ncbi:MAG: sigma-70 family RNA polymerase sigma factor [Verrucomicrobiaceae bacterium]|nr:sigma-70 family RNA polymerase sigma factor [Verrucomicrobiaceae bacterium]
MHSTLTFPMKFTDPPVDACPASSAPAVATDRVAFSILVRQHHRSFLAYARALLHDESTAADLVQEALIIAFRNLAKFDVAGDFPAWVRGIIRNKWRELARERRCELLDDETLQGIEAQHAVWQHALALSQEKNPVFAKLEHCLSRLPEALREAIDACYFQSRNSDEAAVALGASAASIRKRLERARSALRLCIEGETSPA